MAKNDEKRCKKAYFPLPILRDQKIAISILVQRLIDRSSILDLTTLIGSVTCCPPLFPSSSSMSFIHPQIDRSAREEEGPIYFSRTPSSSLHNHNARNPTTITQRQRLRLHHYECCDSNGSSQKLTAEKLNAPLIQSQLS